jgi:hypothetical protein
MKEGKLLFFLNEKNKYSRKMERQERSDDQASAYYQGKIDCIEEILEVIEKANELEKSMKVNL